MGALAERVTWWPRLEQAFERARKADRTYVIEIKVSAFASGRRRRLWDVRRAPVNSRESVRKRRPDHAEGKKKAAGSESEHGHPSGHRADRLVQRRSAASRRRYTARDLSQGEPRRRPSAARRRAASSPWIREAWAILKAHQLRLVSGWFSGRLLDGSSRRRRSAWNSSSSLQGAGRAVMVYAETTGSVQGHSRRPSASGRAFPPAISRTMAPS